MKKHLLTTLVGPLACNIVSNAQTIYVWDYTANTIDKIAPGGAVTTFASGLNNPFGIAADSSGDLFVADAAAAISINIPVESKAFLSPGSRVSFTG